MSKIKESYRKIFNIKEIEDSYLLQLLFYVLTFSFFVTFNGWMGSAAISLTSFYKNTNICPPYFQSCGEWYFLQILPYGYSQSFFYVMLYMALVFGVYSAVRKDWVSAHMAILVGFVWKVLWIFVFTYGLQGNFDYYDMTLAFVFLFLSSKEYFAKLVFVFLYFIASTIKIHEGWIFGNYFNSLVTGAPIFGVSTIPVFTNILIVMQMLGCWFLLSKNKILQKLAFVYFLIFHIYSGIIVHYRYIAISIPALIVLFGGFKDWEILKISKKTIAGYLFLVFLLIGQMTAIFIEGDQKKTLEGNYYGLFMFEANHACNSLATIYYKDQIKKEIYKENRVANNRCDPYSYYFPLKQACNKDKQTANNIDKISLVFDHSINGNKFERLVNQDNVCDLEYKSFAHNSWIQLDNRSEKLEIPVYKTGYLYPLDNEVKVLASPYVNEKLLNFMTILYWILWILTLMFIILALLYKQFWVKNK